MNKLLRVVLGWALIVTVLSPWHGIQPAQAQAVEEIATAADLAAISADLAGSYRLAADIDLSSVSNWTALGTEAAPFTGTLDGGDHAIRNLVLANTQTVNQGLFGVIGPGASVSNLRIEDATVTAADNAGILAGVNRGTVSRVAAQGIITGGTVVGGLVGDNYGEIANSFAIASVSGRNQNGGLVGSNTGGTLINTYAASEVTASVTNNYIKFSGDDYISIPHNAAYVTDSFTLEAWFQWTPPGDDRTSVDFITGKGLENFEIHTGVGSGGSGTNGIRFIPILRSDTLYSDSRAYQDVPDVLKPGWNHVAAVWDYADETAMVLLNGIPQAIYQGVVKVGTEASIPLRNPNANPLANNTNAFFIGARNDLGGQPFFLFHGNIADVRFWKTVRTPEQISADKYKQLTGDEQNLIGYWKLNETSGTLVNDSSAVHNNGTMMGTPERVHEESTNGGLVGVNTGTISSSYYDATVSGMADDGNGTPLPTAQMRQQSFFGGWDFGPGGWKINEGYTYPTLFTHAASVSIATVTPTPVSYGQSYAASIAVGPHYLGVPTGSVTVDDGDGGSCTSPLTPGSPSAGSCSLSSNAGSKTLTATYSGDSIFSPASGSSNQTVNKADQAPLTLSAPASLTYGENATLSASGGGGTGVVTYSTGASTGCAVTGATLSVTNASGECTVTATKAGDDNYSAVSSLAVTVALLKSATTTTISGDAPDPSMFGEDFAVSVSIAGASGTPTGIVEVSNGSGATCTITLVDGAGSCDLKSANVGSITLTATYAGDDNFSPASDTEAHTGIVGQTHVTLADHVPDPSGPDEDVTFAISVAPVAGATGTPTGMADVLLDGEILCSGALSSGQASCTSDGLSTGTYTLTARYNGDAHFAGSLSDEASHSVQDIDLDDNQTSTTFTTVGRLATGGGRAPYTYQLQTGGRFCTPANGAGNAGFTIEGDTLQRKTTTGSGIYEICVASEDATGGTIQESFSVIITDPPILDGTSLGSRTVGIPETEVGRLTVAGGRAPFTYTLAATGPVCTAINASGNASFTLGLSGDMLTRRTATPAGVYPICVQVTDAEGDVTQYAYSITVSNAPQALALSRTTVTTRQTEVGVFSAQEGLPPVSYSLQSSGEVCTAANGADNDAFVINGARLEKLSGTAAGTYAICAQAEDANGMVTEASFTIEVTASPTELRLSSQTVKTSQEAVGTLSTVGGLSPYAYSLATSGAVCSAGHAADNALFEVEGNALGRLSAATAGSYTICLQTGDANGEAVQREFEISVVRDDPPPADWHVDLTANQVIESDPIGTVVGSLVSNRTGATYTLVDATAFPLASNFAINSHGELLLAKALTANTPSTLPIRVRATAPDGEVKDVDGVITVMKNGSAAGAVAGNDTGNLQEGGSLRLDVLANDQMTDEATDWSSMQIVRYPRNGSARIGSIIYTPEPGFHGTDSVTYRACDNLGYCVMGSVEFTVAQVQRTYYFAWISISR